MGLRSASTSHVCRGHWPRWRIYGIAAGESLAHWDDLLPSTALEFGCWCCLHVRLLEALAVGGLHLHRVLHHLPVPSSPLAPLECDHSCNSGIRGVGRSPILAAHAMRTEPNHSMERMGASRSGQLQLLRQWRLAPTAHAGRYESALNVPTVPDSDARGLARGAQRTGSA